MTIVYKINGETVTPTEFTKRSRKRQKLHGGIAEICRARRPPAADDDETHTRINRSGLSYQERELIAKRAKAAGLPEEIAYDPTLPPGHQLYESRAQANAALAHDKAEANRREGKPVYRLNPRHVKSIKAKMLAENPSLKKRDQRDLEGEIIHNHSLPE